jgi:cell pole-organizing protein PopZ
MRHRLLLFAIVADLCAPLSSPAAESHFGKLVLTHIDVNKPRETKLLSMLMAQAAEIPEIGEDRGQLTSREVNNAVHAAFNALAQTVLVSNARTLEAVVREMLQPMLKVWLDDNLPGVVERLVRVEIEQISPRRRLASAGSHAADRPDGSF